MAAAAAASAARKVLIVAGLESTVMGRKAYVFVGIKELFFSLNSAPKNKALSNPRINSYTAVSVEDAVLNGEAFNPHNVTATLNEKCGMAFNSLA